jgi:hypothetical protein
MRPSLKRCLPAGKQIIAHSSYTNVGCFTRPPLMLLRPLEQEPIRPQSCMLSALPTIVLLEPDSVRSSDPRADSLR